MLNHPFVAAIGRAFLDGSVVTDRRKERLVGNDVLDPAAKAESEKHLDAATRNAGNDPLFTEVIRHHYGYTAERAGWPPELDDQRPVPLTRLFDDMWYVGMRYVGQFVIKTGTGLFLLDTLCNAGEAEEMTVPALQSIGLSDDFPLLGALSTHGHYDHFGGAQYLQDKFGIPVYQGSGDSSDMPFTVTPIDSARLERQMLEISPDYELALIPTPGHSPGTVSGIVPVHHNGVLHKLAFWGGTAMPRTAAEMWQYFQGSERLYALADAEKASGTISTHPFVDGTLVHIDNLASSGNEPNPFLLGQAQTLRSLAILRECSAAKVAQLDGNAQIPVWRVTTIDFVQGSPTVTSLSARVDSGWGPVAGQKVRFTVDSTGASVVATTNSDGVATCHSLPQPIRPFEDSITAAFAGSEADDYINLASSTTAVIGTPATALTADQTRARAGMRL